MVIIIFKICFYAFDNEIVVVSVKEFICIFMVPDYLTLNLIFKIRV